MDDYVDLLIEEQNNPNGLLLEILASGYEAWDYIAAVEGPDDPQFYFDFLKECLGTSNIRFLPCGGKDALLKFRNVASDYEWSRAPKFLYICDKDFDDYLGRIEENVWYTSLYSIESYVVEPVHVSYVLSKYSSAGLTSPERKRFVDAYASEMRRLALLLRPFAAFMCEVRAGGEHPSFDDFGIEELLDVRKRDLPPLSKSYSRAVETLKVKFRPTWKGMLARTRSFDPNKWGMWLRGKLALQVARKAYSLAENMMPASIKKKLPIEQRLTRTSLSYMKNALIELPGLCQYCARYQ